MQFLRLLKHIWLIGIAVIVSIGCNQQPGKPQSLKQSSYKQPTHKQLKPNVTVPAVPDEKEFKVQSQPFDLNGVHLQYQYTVKYAIYSDQPTEKVQVVNKKLVDLGRGTVVFEIADENELSIMTLADIDNERHSPDDFDDVNFDGYKDIRESCEPCSGTLGNVESIYLFNHRKKTFQLWQSVMGISVELDPKNKTVQCYTKRAGGGEFSFQEIKFANKGVELYEKQVECDFLDEKKHTFKVTYSKFVGGKEVAHRTRIINEEESQDPWTVITEMTE